MITATAAETFRWTEAALVGFTLEKDGERLPGLITLDLGDVERSIALEVHRYLNDYVQVTKLPDGTKVREEGAWAPVGAAQLAAALLSAVRDPKPEADKEQA